MSSTERSKFTDYYALLGVLPSADLAKIRRAYIAKAKEHHPDAGGKTEYMQLLNIAYKTLINPRTKPTYDMSHNFHTSSTKPSDYKYHDSREVKDIADMSDGEIDAFLDELLQEFRQPVELPKTSVKQRLKRFFEI